MRDWRRGVGLGETDLRGKGLAGDGPTWGWIDDWYRTTLSGFVYWAIGTQGCASLVPRFAPPWAGIGPGLV